MVTRKRQRGYLRRGLDEQIRTMHIGTERAAAVALCRKLADRLDSRGLNDKLLREYRLALRLLTDDVVSGSGDAFEKLLAEFTKREAEAV